MNTTKDFRLLNYYYVLQTKVLNHSQRQSCELKLQRNASATRAPQGLDPARGAHNAPPDPEAGYLRKKEAQRRK